MIKIAFFGECMVELNKANHFRFGGDSLNTALYLARTSLKSQFQVSFVSAVGADEESEYLLSSWRAEGIATEYISVIANKSLGSYQIETESEGERRFFYDRGDSAAKYYFHSDHQKLTLALVEKRIDYFYFTGISLAILSNQHCQLLFSLLKRFKSQGGKVIFDNNYRAVLWQGREVLPCYQQAMQLADIALLTDEDEYALYGGDTAESILQRYEQQGLTQQCEIVIKQGRQPCVIKSVPLKKTEEQAVIQVSCQQINIDKVIDTCAAGDAFAAGYLAKRLIGQDIITAAKFAHQLAGRVIQFSGAIIGHNHMADLMPKKSVNPQHYTSYE